MFLNAGSTRPYFHIHYYKMTTLPYLLAMNILFELGRSKLARNTYISILAVGEKVMPDPRRDQDDNT